MNVRLWKSWTQSHNADDGRAEQPKGKTGGFCSTLFFFFLIFSSYEDVKTKLLQTSHLFPDVVLEENPMRLKLKYKSL